MASRAIAFLFTACVAFSATSSAADLKVMFLGDRGHHQPKPRFDQLQPVLAGRGIELIYTDNVDDLNPDNLQKYDAVLLYANIDEIESGPERALLDYVSNGGGFVPLHCATYCFRNSPELVALMGGQFKSHGTGVFRSTIANSDHPVMSGFGGFESWDESYVHHLHNEKDRTVLSYRVDENGREPWTWVRTDGEGRVFYTAWGHDQRTWGNPGFQNLVERGIRWAAGDDVGKVSDYLEDRPFPVPKMNPLPDDLPPFELIEAGGKIPNYTPGKQWGTQGDAITKMQKPLDPQQSMKHLVVPQGFHVELFASEPEIGGKPIAMAWDERGRLWLAETYDYPNELQPPGKGRDRIRILEDTDGDWKADKFTVFAEKLSIPTSMTFHQGGVIVHDGTRTLYLKDTDGDDVADQTELMFTGWNQGDTHGGVSNFQYGLDNWIWAMQGYNQSAPRSQDVQGQSFRQGFFRFRPDGSQVEFIRSTNNNTWGLGISEEGLIFGSTANHNPSVFMPIANRYYERVRGWAPSLRLGTIADTHLFNPITENIRQVDHHGGYTAAAGHALYTARQYPQPYWNRTAFVNGPTGHLTGTFVLQSDGSDFKSTSPFNLLASDDQWTAPIMAEVGPDGNLWVIDWYNYIIQHNPTPRGFTTGKGNAYETVLRDKKFGRIYRVVHDGATIDPIPDLSDASVADLVATLRHPTMLWRKHAQRLLVEQGGDEPVAALIELVRDDQVDPIGLNVGAIHALWTLHGLGQLDSPESEASRAAVAALRHPSAGVRRNALQVLAVDPDSTAAVLASDVMVDGDAQVRLAAALALSDLPPSKEAGLAVLAAVERNAASPDRWISDALTSAASNNAESFLAGVALSSDPDGQVLETMKVVSSHYGRSAPVDSVGTVVESLTAAEPTVAEAILSGIADGWPGDRKPTLDKALEENLQALMQRLPASGKGMLVRLARQWGSKHFESYVETISDSLLERIDDESLSMPQRIAAARQLIEFRSRDDEATEALLERITPQTGGPLAAGIVSAIGASQSPAAGLLLVEKLGGVTPATRMQGISVLMSRPELTKALLQAIDKGQVLLSEMSLDQQQALMAHPDKEIQLVARRLLNRGGALPDANRQAVLKQMMPATVAQGDVAAGKAVFKKNCANCHVLNGEGQRVGPDLTGMAVHPKAELLTHILDPSRDVEGNYRVYTLLTFDGVVINGLLASESKTAIEVYDAEGKKRVVLREDIDQLQASTKSLMPEGFEKQIPIEAMTDLLEFLTARGQFLPIDMAKVANVASDRGMFISRDADVERLVFPDWSPKVFKKVTFQLTDPRDGTVPNAILLNSPQSPLVQGLAKRVSFPCNGPARAIHFLSGVSGWGFPYGREKTVSMVVRLHYQDGKEEDHELLNGEHFADYIRRVDVPQSEFAFALRGQQIRYLAVYPQRGEPIDRIELIKGPDRTAPVVMAITIESAGTESSGNATH